LYINPQTAPRAKRGKKEVRERWCEEKIREESRREGRGRRRRVKEGKRNPR
jgi:hypothetical protein